MGTKYGTSNCLRLYDITKKLSCKQDKSVCSERHPVLSSNIEGLFRHKHPIHEGKDMTGGVIIP